MFLPNNIDFAESTKYILSIRLIPNGFYFSIHCPSDKTIFYQNRTSFDRNSNYLKNIEKLIFDYAFFSYNYRKINVICIDDATTIIPNEFYDKKMASNFLSFNYLHPKEHVISNEIAEQNCKVVWAMDQPLHNFLSRALLNPSLVNHLSFLVPYCYKLHDKSTKALFVNFNDNNRMDVVGFMDEKLTLAKTFCVSNPLEDSYYIQKTWDALALNAQTDKLFFAGQTDNYKECIDSLKKVVSKTESLPFKLSDDINISREEIPTEILIQLCEL